jgi:hypothetical protein
MNEDGLVGSSVDYSIRITTHDFIGNDFHVLIDRHTGSGFVGDIVWNRVGDIIHDSIKNSVKETIFSEINKYEFKKRNQ